jgi:hypothetical protein
MLQRCRLRLEAEPPAVQARASLHRGTSGPSSSSAPSA